MKKPLINILTRTSNRPNYFRNCFESVKNQTYDNINHIISVDDDITEEYVKKYTDNYIKVKRTGVKKPPVGVRRYAPYNLYLNYLKNQVKDGWIMFLDDDDSFTNNDSLESIVNKIENVNQLLLWKVEFPGRIIPNNNIFNKKIIVLNNFSMIGFMYHKKYDDIMFDDYSGGDFYFMKNLFPKIPNKIWVDEIYTKVQRNNMGGFGKRDDLKINKQK